MKCSVLCWLGDNISQSYFRSKQELSRKSTDKAPTPCLSCQQYIIVWTLIHSMIRYSRIAIALWEKKGDGKLICTPG